MLRLFGMIIQILAPFIEMLNDYKYRAGGYLRSRFYSKQLCSCGEGLIINGKPLLLGLKNITIGNHVTINNGAQICPRGHVTIDDYVVMSRGAQITAGQLDSSKFFGGGVQGCSSFGYGCTHWRRLLAMCKFNSITRS